MSSDVFVWIDQTNGEVDSIAWESAVAARKLANDLGGQVVALVLGGPLRQFAYVLQARAQQLEGATS